MSKKKMPEAARKPEYLRQKRGGMSDRAYTRINGQKYYLGTWKSPESLQAYARLVAESAAGAVVSVKLEDKITVIELCRHYYGWAAQYYGEGGDLSLVGGVIAVLNELYGTLPVEDFSPLKLEAVLQTFVKKGLTREGCNRRMKRIRHMVKWGVAKELIPPAVHQGLQCVPALRRGRTTAPDPEPRQPARLDHIAAAKPYLLPVLADALELLLLTGGRPGEVLGLRVKDIATGDDDIWHSKLDRHKNLNKGKDRFLYYGPKAKEIVRRRMAGKSFDDYLFDPREAIAQRADIFKTHRRPDQKPNRRKTKRTIRNYYEPEVFRRAIERACQQAETKRLDDLNAAQMAGREREAAALVKMGVIRFSPYQVRHTAATIIRARFGLEQARAVLGHETPDMTLVYAQRDEEAVKSVMRQIG